MHFKNAMFSPRHLVPICLAAAINTDDVGIGSPEASMELSILPRATITKLSAQHTFFSEINRTEYEAPTHNYFQFEY